MNYKRGLIVKFGRLKKKITNSDFYSGIEDEIMYFEDYGFGYGLKEKLFPPISEDKFIKKMIDFELKPYGINYNYIINLPKKPIMPINYNTGNKDYNNKRQQEYVQRMYYILDNIYNGFKQEFQDNGMTKYKFKNVKEYIKFEKYFYKLYPKTKSGKPNEHEISNAFSGFNLQYGLSYDFEYEEIEKYKNKKK